MFNNKNILITGGTGTFGENFVEYLINQKIKFSKLIIYSRDEHKQFYFQNRLSKKEKKNIRFFIGDVRDLNRLKIAFKEVDIVIHAAAMKHVSTAEYNPFECVSTNIIGAQNVCLAAMSENVKNVIALSTDKASNPINLYGATKLAADKVFIGSNIMSGSNGCKFSVVRYGNVFGSRGSILPLFRNLIANKTKELPITDYKMTRFVITIEEAIEFVINSLKIMRGGEIFIPKIPSIRIIDLAKALAPELPIKIIGMRSGEKINESMFSSDESLNIIEHKYYYIIEPNKDEHWYKSHFNKQYKKVEKDFSYRSDINNNFLSISQIKKIINKF